MSNLEPLFMCLLAICMSSSERYTLVFCPLFDFFLILSFLSCVFIFEINHLPIALFGNIFSDSDGFLLALFMVSFAMQKLLSLNRSHLKIFFIFITLIRCGDLCQRVFLYVPCCELCQRMFILLYCMKFYSVQLGLQFILSLGMVLGSVLISLFYMKLSRFPSTIYWRSCLFSTVYSCLFCPR